MDDSLRPTRSSQLDAIVVGAGISGLAAAQRLKKQGRDVLVLEAGPRPGGSIWTDRVDGFLVERGPNSVRMTDELEELVVELGLVDEVVAGDPRAPRYLVHENRLEPAPMGLGKMIRTPLLTAGGKLRILAEPFIGRPKEDREQSIEEFITRRLGRQIHDVFVSAFVSGIYAGDTRRLSADAVFPKLVELEREYGGLVRGGVAMMAGGRKKAAATSAEKRPKRRRPITISSFASGLDRLPRAIGEMLGESLRLNTPVERVARRDGGFAVTAGGEDLTAERVYVATPAFTAAKLLRSLSPELAAPLEAIEYSPLASVALAYREDEVEHSCEGFGFLAPRTSGLRTLGAIFSSSLFSERAPEGWVLITCFIGGATDPGVVTLDDEELVAQVAGDLEKTLGARATPRVLAITRWQQAIPQYNLGHRQRVAAIEQAAESAGVRMLGNYLHGVSVGECVASAQKAVEA